MFKCWDCGEEINGLYYQNIKGEREFVYGVWEVEILENITVCEGCYNK